MSQSPNEPHKKMTNEEFVEFQTRGARAQMYGNPDLEPRMEKVDGEWKYTYDTADVDSWDHVDDDVRLEQDNQYAGERMAEMYDELGDF